MDVKKSDLDRIVISTYEQTEKIIKWVDENKELIYDENGYAPFPMQEGCICLEEEGIDFTFKVISENNVFVTVYPGRIDTPAFTYKLDPCRKKDKMKDQIQDIKIVGVSDQIKRQQLAFIVAYDNTAWKEAVKLMSIMAFMANYEEIVVVDEKQNQHRNRRVARAMRTGSSPLPLVKKTYIVLDFDEKKLRLPGQPRAYTKPDHEVAVRGHYRHLKSGKVIWIREHSHYKDKGNKKPKEYRF